MKRFFALILTVVLVCLLITSASADLRFTTNSFDFVLPNNWYYLNASLYYAECRSDSSEAFNLYESNITIPETLEEIKEQVVQYFGAQDYVTGYEEVEISGQKTALVEFIANKKPGYMTLIHVGEKTVGAFYLTAAETADSKIFINALSSVTAREEKNKGFFRYGDVEVKFKNFTTKTSGGKKYLILNFIWRNVGTAPTMFVVNVGVTAFQDGIELHEGYLFGEQTEVGTQIMPGKELPVKVIFELRSKTGEVTFTVDKLIDALNQAVDREYTINVK